MHGHMDISVLKMLLCCWKLLSNLSGWARNSYTCSKPFFFFLKKMTLVFERKTLPLLLAISCSIRHITTKVAAAVVRTAVAEELAEGHNDVDLKELMHMSEVCQICFHFNLSHSCACPRWRCTWSTQVMHLVCAFYAGRDCGLCSSQYVVPYLLPACSWEMRPHIISLQS